MHAMAFSRRDLLALGACATLFGSTAGEARALPQAGLLPRSREPLYPGDAAQAEARRTALYDLLGDVPDRHRPLDARRLSEEVRDGYVLERWTLDLNGLEPVPAYVARPRTVQGRAPGIVFNHSHGGGYTIGKQEFVRGREYLQPTPYAKELTDLGYVAIAIDHWVFGERSGRTEGDAFKEMLWKGQVLWGMMVYDSLRALDVLADRPDVDPARIGTVGISMGSTMAWWLAALDPRVKVTVDICCLTDFHTLVEKAGLGLHGVYYYVPRLLQHFTTSQINALIAPRAHLGIAGLRDPLTPVEGLDIIDRDLQAVYREAGHAERWALLRYDVGHQETAEARRAIVEFFQRFL